MGLAAFPPGRDHIGATGFLHRLNPRLDRDYGESRRGRRRGWVSHDRNGCAEKRNRRGINDFPKSRRFILYG